MKMQPFPVTKLIKELQKHKESTMYNLILDKLGNRIKIMRDIRNTYDKWELDIVDHILLRTVNLDALNNRVDETIRQQKYSNAITFKKRKGNLEEKIRIFLHVCPEFKEHYQITKKTNYGK